MEELTKIIKEMQESIKETGLKIKPDVLFDNAVRILNTQYIQNNKKFTVPSYFQKEINHEIKVKPNKPTEKQIYALKKYGYAGDIDNLNFHEASALISKYKESEY